MIERCARFPPDLENVNKKNVEQIDKELTIFSESVLYCGRWATVTGT